MKHSYVLPTVCCLLPLGCACTASQKGSPTIQQAAAVPSATGILECSFERSGPAAVTVNWTFRNDSAGTLWLPIGWCVSTGFHWDMTLEKLPLMFVVPGDRMIGVSAMFAEMPGSLGIDEGNSRLELAQVRPGGILTGMSEVRLPFKWKDPGMVRPNPFTPWGAGNYEVEIEETKVQRIRTFQMAAQVFALPDRLVKYYTKADGRVIANDSPPPEHFEGITAEGKYWAAAISRIENRRPSLRDFAIWAVSPVYKVEWPVGEHPPVGLKNEFDAD